MSERTPPARVGVRELRQNLSVYLDRVKEGETLEVTEHGHPVARLGPAPAPRSSVLERLLAEGRATPPSRNLDDVLAEPQIEVPAGVRSVSDALRESREAETR
jgi:prevent-host-death family protein